MTNETKTDFSEWLVASDIDGTLNNKFRKLPQRNYDAIKEFVVNKIENPQVNFMSSSISSFEMLDKGIHKGVGVKKIAELYGIQHKHTAAIGDYFNDYEMLKSVYLSACCGQAPKAIHDIVKFEACHCNNGAVADLLNYIMYNYKED